MKAVLIFVLGCLAGGPTRADDAINAKPKETALASGGGFLVRSTVAEDPREGGRDHAIPLAKPDPHATSLATAIANAANKDFIDAGIEASRNMLIECQRETSVVLVTPSLRSNSQRDHCFRF